MPTAPTSVMPLWSKTRAPQAADLGIRRTAAQEPWAAVRRVEPAERTAGRAGGLVETRVAMQGVGEKPAVGRMGPLLVEEFGLGSERHLGEVVGREVRRGEL